MAILLLTHTRTALVAMIGGVVVGGLSLLASRARVRKLFAVGTVVASVGGIALSGFLTTWLARGQNTQELTKLTGRTIVWSAVENIPRTKFQDLFGFGLSNKSFNGLPIDSNWLASYLDQGLFGVAVSAAILVFLLVTAFFQPRGIQRALALFLVTYCLAASFTETGSAMRRPTCSTSPWRHPCWCRARRQPADMRVMQVHNRYRSAAPSGENRVVDQERDALAATGHDVIRFERYSDDIEQWSRVKKATMPAQVVWSRESRNRACRRACARDRPDVVHLHNTFPLLSPSVLYACRSAAVPVVATLHNYKLACVSGDFFRHGAVCHDCAGGLPVPAVLHGCYRGLARRDRAGRTRHERAPERAWRSLVSAYIFISKSQRDLLAGLHLPADRVFVRDNLIPRQPVPAGAREPMVVYAGRLDEAKGAAAADGRLGRYLESSAGPG